MSEQEAEKFRIEKCKELRKTLEPVAQEEVDHLIELRDDPETTRSFE
jgi:rubrerythrin